MSDRYEEQAREEIRNFVQELHNLMGVDEFDMESINENLEESNHEELDYIRSGLTWVIGLYS